MALTSQMSMFGYEEKKTKRMIGEVLEINSDIATEFLLPRHYSGRVPSISKAFGWFVKGELKAVCTFGKPASPALCVGVCGEKYADRVYELNRLCREDDFHEPWEDYSVYYSMLKATKNSGLDCKRFRFQEMSAREFRRLYNKLSTLPGVTKKHLHRFLHIYSGNDDASSVAVASTTNHQCKTP